MSSGSESENDGGGESKGAHVKLEPCSDSDEVEEEVENEQVMDSALLSQQELKKERVEEDPLGSPSSFQEDDPLEEEPDSSPLLHLLPPIHARSKEEFGGEMEKAVAVTVRECVHQLQRDPREYHPYYLTVQHFITAGLAQGYIPEGMEVLMWAKCEKFAAAEYAKMGSSSGGIQKRQQSSVYLKRILGQQVKKSGGSKVVASVSLPWKLERDFRVAVRAAKKWMEERADYEFDLKGRLQFFQHFQHVTSPDLIVAMNSLWSRFLSPPPPPETILPEDVEDDDYDDEPISRSKRKSRSPPKAKSTKRRAKAKAPPPAKRKRARSLETSDDEKQAQVAAKNRERMRLKRERETPEEIELRRQSQRERSRKRRANKTPEERERQRIKDREAARRRRQQLKEEIKKATTTAATATTSDPTTSSSTATTTPTTDASKLAAYEARRARLNEIERFRRARETPEQRQSRLARDAERMRRKRQELKEAAELELLQKRIKKSSESEQVDQSAASPSSETTTTSHLTRYELLKKADAEKARIRRAANRDAENQKRKKRLANLTEEERARRQERLQGYKKRRAETLTEEEKAQIRVKKYMGFVAYCARLGVTPTDYNAEAQRRWRANMTEEKKRRHQEYLRNYSRARYLQIKGDPVKWAEFNEKMRAVQRRRTRNETPEQRLKRLTRFRINQAKKKLRREMEAEAGGEFTEEEFQRRAEELALQIQSQAAASSGPQSTYKPRKRKRNSSESSSSSSPHQHQQPGRPYTIILPRIPTSYDNQEEPMIPADELLQQHSSYSNTPQPPLLLPGRFFTAVSVSNPTTSVPPHHHHPQPSKSAQGSSAVEPSFQIEFDFEPVDDESASACPSPPPSPPSPPHLVEEEFHAKGEPRDGWDKTAEDEAVVSSKEDASRRHVDTNSHLLLPFGCVECPARFGCKELLRSHLGSTHASTCWKCPECARIMVSPAEFSLHYESVHGAGGGGSGSGSGDEDDAGSDSNNGDDNSCTGSNAKRKRGGGQSSSVRGRRGRRSRGKRKYY